MDFIFVSNAKSRLRYAEDPSFIYRCINLSKGLQEAGYAAKELHLSEITLSTQGEMFIFHRPSLSWRFIWVWLILKLRKKALVIDVDDLIFEPTFADVSPAYLNGILTLSKVKRKFLRHKLAFSFFSHFTVSTKPLERHIKASFPKSSVLVVHNAPFYAWHKESLLRYRSDEKIIGYFPGTKSHDRDFAQIAKAIERFLADNPQIKLRIVGSLDFSLNVRESQIEYIPKVPFSRHHQNFQKVWVNIAPLENTEFNKCKSALKVIEAAFFKIPTITIENSDNKRLIDAGAIVVKDEKGFLDTLNNLKTKKVYDEVVGKIEQNFLIKSNLQSEVRKFLDFFDESFPHIAAKKMRNQGVYDKKTLKLYIKAYLKEKSFKNYLAFAMFCRDLGYKLSVVRYKRLKKFFLTIVSLKAHGLILEYRKGLGFLSPKVIKISKKSRQAWQKEFHEYIKGKSICVVGNSATLKGKRLGDVIDGFDIVVRFNDCCRSLNEDLGKKIDIWVTSPDLKSRVEAQWSIITGPDVLYRGANWSRFEGVDFGSYRILTVQLDLWKELVGILKAPPSAGILTLYMLYKQRGSFANMAIVGFDLKSESSQYHYHDSLHKASLRHNWDKERALIRKWITKGLCNLEDSTLCT